MSNFNWIDGLMTSLNGKIEGECDSAIKQFNIVRLGYAMMDFI